MRLSPKFLFRACSRRAFVTQSVSSQDATSSSQIGRPRTAMFFPGQGVQRVGMIKPWLDAFPRTVKPFCEEMDDVLGMKMTQMIEEGRQDALTATENAQPAIMATSVMILQVLEREFNFDTKGGVNFTLGHSLGEFAALVAGGYLDKNDSLLMVKKRADAMAQCAKEAREEEGEVGMVALICEPDRLDSMIEAIHEFTGYGSSGSKSDSSELPPLQQVLVANINSKNQVVVSGSIARIRTLLSNLREFGGHDPRHVQLKADCPFHSPLMQPAADMMKRWLSQPRKNGDGDIVRFDGTIPCVSNVTARPFSSREELKDLLARQCVETVLWWDSIKYLHKEENVRRWIGIGPGKVGRNLVGKEVGRQGDGQGGGVFGISEPEDIERIMKELDQVDSAIED